jgi:lipopolysaccharide transport system permease protein
MRRKIEAFIRYRDIVWYRTFAGLKSEARQNFLGYVWFLLDPAINTATMYLVYVLIFHSRDPSTVPMLLLGTMSWQWFESSITVGMQGIRSKLHIMIHFTLPKFIFPLVGIFANTWKFLCVFVVLLAVCAFCGDPPHLSFLYLPLVMGAQLVLIVGLTLPLAIMTAYFNDMVTVASSVFRLLMFLSGVFFYATQVPGDAGKYIFLNPMAGLIDCYREIVVYRQSPNMYALIYAVLFGLIFCLIGLTWSFYIDGKILKRVSG